MRHFKDENGVEWEAEAVPAQEEIQPGKATPMMDEVGWRVRFIAKDPPAGRFAIVSPEIGIRFDELNDDALRELLAAAT